MSILHHTTCNNVRVFSYRGWGVGVPWDFPPPPLSPPLQALLTLLYINQVLWPSTRAHDMDVCSYVHSVSLGKMLLNFALHLNCTHWYLMTTASYTYMYVYMILYMHMHIHDTVHVHVYAHVKVSSMLT